MRAILVAAAAVLFVGVFFSPTLAAQDVTDDFCRGEGANSSVCQGRTLSGQNPVNVIIANVIQLIIAVTAFASVITMMIAGFRYITSSGNPETTNAAKNAILFAIIGLVIALMGQLLVSYVLRSL